MNLNISALMLLVSVNTDIPIGETHPYAPNTHCRKAHHSTTTYEPTPPYPTPPDSP